MKAPHSYFPKFILVREKIMCLMFLSYFYIDLSGGLHVAAQDVCSFHSSAWLKLIEGKKLDLASPSV